MTVTRLTFIRHGETAWNRAQRFQGHADIPLNEAGHAQALALAERLADDKPDHVVCSDLLRAQQTAAPLLEHWRLQAELDARLREQGFGVLEGLDADAIRTSHGDLWDLWTQHQADFAPPGGESTRQFSARVLQTVRALAQAQVGKHIMVFTHGGVLDMLWRHVHALPLHGRRDCAIPNTGINRLRWDGGALHIECWGDASHLPKAPLSP